MPNPTIVACPQDTWVKVATNVSAGQIIVKNTTAQYQVTYRVTGDPAPTDLNTGQPILGVSIPIFANVSEPVDVYVYAHSANGSVEVNV